MEHILNDHELNKEGSTPTVCVKYSVVGFLHFSWTTLRPSVEVRRLRSGRRGTLSKVLVKDTVCKACALFPKALWARHHGGAFFWGLCLAFRACCHLAYCRRLPWDNMSQRKTSTLITPSCLWSPAAQSVCSKPPCSQTVNFCAAETVISTSCPSAWHIKGIMKRKQVSEEPGENGV